MENMKSKVLFGLIWKFGERISAQLVTFVVSIVLARLLDPSHYGAIAIVNIFIALANVFVVSGFGNSLIQKADADELDFSSVFHFSIVMSIVLYIILFICAPLIADFYNMPILSPTLRVLGLRIIVAGVNSVQHAFVSRKMLFKRFFWSTLGGTVVSGIVGIVMAYHGYGIWALVAQYMVNTTVDTIVLFITVKWRPKLLFSLKRLGKMFSFGWKLLVSSLIDTGYAELKSLVIGKMYTSSELAFYNKGKNFPNLIVANVNSSINSVLFPAMSKSQDSCEQIKLMTRRAIRVSSYIMFPLLIGLALIGESFIRLLLTEKWLFCVPFLQISCLTYMMMPIHTSNLQAIKAIGRSDIFLKLEIIKKIIGLVALFISMRYGVLAIALSGIVTTIIATVINSFPNRKFINYGYFEQIKDLFNGIVPLAAMVVSVLLAGMLDIGDLLKIAIQVIVGAIAYISVSALTKNEPFRYSLTLVRQLLKKKGKKQ